MNMTCGYDPERTSNLSMTCEYDPEDQFSQVIHVWELQRRTTLFHSDWRAPFLPHDREKRVGWVGADSKKHPLFAHPRSGAVAAITNDSPPLEAPAGWRFAESGWELVTDPIGPQSPTSRSPDRSPSRSPKKASKDPNGWQYAFDFQRSDSHWGDNASLCHCRRRLWQCELVKAPRSVQPRQRVVDIWELQRRTTIFQQDWGAPFLPHDRKKRWRWLDLDYRLHPWSCSGSRKTFAACEEPPLAPPPSWRQCTKWTVLPSSGSEQSSGGWEYAVDFYQDDNLWSSSKTAAAGCHCRRRLWRCTFEEEIFQRKTIISL
jgi:hypothetical protein